MNLNLRKIGEKSLKIAAFSLFLFVSVYSQTGTSTITGSVSDAQGNAVPGATVTLISGTNNRREIVTNDSGIYTFASVLPGKYQIEVESKGF